MKKFIVVLILLIITLSALSVLQFKVIEKEQNTDFVIHTQLNTFFVKGLNVKNENNSEEINFKNKKDLFDFLETITKKESVPQGVIVWNDDEESIPIDGSIIRLEFTRQDTIFIGPYEEIKLK